MKNLVIKLGALGDIIIATSLIRRLQSHYPDDEFWLLTTPAFAGLFANWPGLQVKAIPRKGWRNMFTAVRWIRGQGFDRLFDFQSNDRSSALVALSGVPMRVGNLPRFPYTHHPPTRYRSEIHIFERMNQVLAAAGIPPAEPSPWLPAGEEDRAYVQDWLQGQGIDAGKDIVLMHAGASARWPSKRWPFYDELAKALELHGLRVIWLGADEDAELNAELARTAGIDATGQFTILQLAELGRHARFAVTNDSGPMHILSSAGIPIYAFFGPTNWVKNHALGQAGRVLRHPVDCSPCFQGTCPPEHQHECLAGLPMEQVLARLDADGLLPQP